MLRYDIIPANFEEVLNRTQWPRATGNQNPVLDGFTVKRTGDTSTTVRLVLYPEHFPEQYKVSPELGDVLGIKEESRLGVIQTLWNYIKIQGLQDKTDRRIVRADEKLLPVRLFCPRRDLHNEMFTSRYLDLIKFPSPSYQSWSIAI